MWHSVHDEELKGNNTRHTDVLVFASLRQSLRCALR